MNAEPTPTTEPGPADVLAHEPGRPRRWPWFAAASIAALVLAGVVGERQVATAQFDTVLSRCAQSQTAVSYDSARVNSVVNYVTPLLQMATTPSDVRAGLAALVEQAAARGASDLAGYARDVRRAPVLPWRSELRTARASCAGYVDAWVSYLQAVSGDVNALSTSRAALDARLSAARSALLAAAPNATAAAEVSRRLPGG